MKIRGSRCSKQRRDVVADTTLSTRPNNSLFRTFDRNVDQARWSRGIIIKTGEKVKRSSIDDRDRTIEISLGADSLIKKREGNRFYEKS